MLCIFNQSPPHGKVNILHLQCILTEDSLSVKETGGGGGGISWWDPWLQCARLVQPFPLSLVSTNYDLLHMETKDHFPLISFINFIVDKIEYNYKKYLLLLKERNLKIFYKLCSIRQQHWLSAGGIIWQI